MIYNVYFCALAIGAIIEFTIKQSNKRILRFITFIFFILLVFQDGFRWEIGTDWEPYYQYFEQCNGIQSNSDDFEIGYIWMNKIINHLVGNYTVFLVIHAILLYSAIFYFIKKNSLYPLLSLFLYYAFMNGNMGMNRQFLALMFALISVQFILQRNFIYFITCIGGGLLFHSSILLFIPAYFFQHQLGLKSVIILLSIGIIIAASGIINIIPFELLVAFDDSMSSKMDIYTSGEVRDISPLHTILVLSVRAIWLIVLLFFRNKFNSNIEWKDKFNLCFNLYLISIVVYMIFNGSILQIIVSRGLIYYSIFSILIIPFVLPCFKGSLNKLIVLGMIVLYAWIMFDKNMNAHLQNVGDIFNPYKNVLFNL